MMKKRTVLARMIGNSHIDPVWLWLWQEGYETVRTTFSQVLDNLKKYKKFVFTAASVCHYKWIKENDPSMFNEIKRFIKSKRWEVAGGWWVQPDCNIPSGESFIRQALIGQKFYKDNFGITAQTGYNVDSFGHNAGLPKIMKGCGLKNYIFMRPQYFEKELPSNLFLWESDDGTSVLASRIHSYGTGGDDLEKQIMGTVNSKPRNYDEVLCFYGIGDHGGGPTEKEIEYINKITGQDASIGKKKIAIRAEFSALKQYFDSIRKRKLKLPVVKDDLQYHATGCYTAVAEIKKLNRLVENSLVNAEKFCTISNRLFGEKYPKTELHTAWENLAFNQFHDIMAGSSIAEAYRDARDSLGVSKFNADVSINRGLQKITRYINTRSNGAIQRFVVFNACSWKRTSPVEAESQHIPYNCRLVDSRGQDVPFQFSATSCVVGEWRKKLVFMADLPPLGYATYFVMPSENSLKPESPKKTRGNLTLENKYWRMKISGKKGTITKLFDKTNKIKIISKESNLLQVLQDKSDTWSHGVFEFNKVCGTFSRASVSVTEDGPVRTLVRIRTSYGKSSAVQDIALYKDAPLIETEFLVNWQEKQKFLKLAYNTNLKNCRVFHSIPFGANKKKNNGRENPCQEWVDISGRIKNGKSKMIDYGFTVINDSNYAFDSAGSSLRMSLLRNPVFAHHDPARLTKDYDYKHTDTGTHHFRIGLLAHAGTLNKTRIKNCADEFNNPPVVVREYEHGGNLPASSSFGQATPDNVIISALKISEKGNDIILRCFETAGKDTEAEIKLDFIGLKFKTRFKHNQIKTFRIGERIEEVNHIENLDE